MLTLLLGTDWVANRDTVLDLVTRDVTSQKGRRVLLVPEHISHDMERRLSAAAGDTSSLYAEVVSFTRMVRSVSDFAQRGVEPCLDAGGRLAAMASAARQLHSKLKAYASVETKPEFLTGLVAAVDEFKQCCVTSQDLIQASRNSQGSLAQKLEELALLLDTYDALCLQGKRDPADQMMWLLELLEDCSYASSHVFYVDGFPDFTRQHMAILEHILQYSPEVTVSLTCDKPNSEDPAFEHAAETAAYLLRFAKQRGIEVQIRHVEERSVPTNAIRKKLFSGAITVDSPLAQCLTVQRAQSVYSECVAAAERISDLVRSGVRYRDISVVCANMAGYRNALRMVFQRFSIPLYLSGTENILEKPVIHSLLAAIDAALGGFEQSQILCYLKSVLSPVDPATCDELENYAIAWSIQGSMWQTEWTMHPKGLGAEWTENDAAVLERLNSEKRRAIAPLMELKKGFSDAVNLSQQVTAVYRFLEDLRLSETFDALAGEMEESGDHRNAQIFSQLWEILIGALEQLHDTLGTTVWDADTFVRLLKLILSQYDVGTIPPVLDAVTAGPVDAMRSAQEHHLIVLGAEEGFLPAYPAAQGVLSEQERNELRKLGVSLNGSPLHGLQRAFSDIYGVFCGAESTVCVSIGGGQPSYIYRRLAGLRGGETLVRTPLGTAVGNSIDAGALLVRCADEGAARTLNIEDHYRTLKSASEHTLGSITPEGIRELYGDCLYLSASKVDKQAKCRLSYFLHYGLDAKERKPITLDPAEFGTYVHDVLENTGREVLELGGFRQVSLEQTLQIARQYSEQYVKKQFGQLDYPRQSYLLSRNQEELFAVVEELWQEMQVSEFTPVDFEVSFGNKKQMKPIEIQGARMRAKLTGFVDRVDAWRENGRNYFRVVDYKTGSKTLDFCDLLNGIGLQMLLYLFALEDKGQPVLGDDPIPAGVQYFPARVPVISFQTLPTPEEVASSRHSLWKRDGMVLLDEQVIRAMIGDDLKKVGVKVTKEGAVTGDVATEEQLHMLKGYVYKTLEKIVDDISSGSVSPNPYFRGPNDNACKYCPFGDVCHPEETADRRDFAATSHDLFWEKIESEMKKHG